MKKETKQVCIGHLEGEVEIYYGTDEELAKKLTADLRRVLKKHGIDRQIHVSNTAPHK